MVAGVGTGVEVTSSSTSCSSSGSGCSGWSSGGSCVMSWCVWEISILSMEVVCKKTFVQAIICSGKNFSKRPG